MDARREAVYTVHPEMAIAELDALETLVKEFFSYLDYTEESDSGRVFHPVTLSCCRALMTPKVNECLQKMKSLVNLPGGLKDYDPLFLGSMKTPGPLVRICNKCGWAHVAMSREAALAHVLIMQQQFIELTPEKQIELYGSTDFDPSLEIKQVEQCCRCGNSHYDFHDLRNDEKLRDGITLPGIIKD